MRSMNSNTGEEIRTEDRIGRGEEVEDLEETLKSLKQEKAKQKSAFTRARKQLLDLVNEMDLPSRSQVRDGRAKLDNAKRKGTEYHDSTVRALPMATEWNSKTESHLENGTIGEGIRKGT